MTDETKEKIKLETELLRYLMVAGTATGGSSLGLMVGDPSGFKLALALGGIFASLTFLGLMYVQYGKIYTLIQKGADDES